MGLTQRHNFIQQSNSQSRVWKQFQEYRQGHLLIERCSRRRSGVLCPHGLLLAKLSKPVNDFFIDIMPEVNFAVPFDL
jgi:hypothetical protein